MYVILVYDVGVERVSKVCQFLRRFLNWVQNSVFEGEISESELLKIEYGLKDIIDQENDSIVIYTLSSEKIISRKFIGTKKSEITSII
ncbi:MAG: CRISPR-associated endonuclease Cas2 [Candidatus Aenigmatarchaeota archaeon]